MRRRGGRWSQREQRGVDIAAAIAGERQLVADARGAVVEPQIARRSRRRGRTAAAGSGRRPAPRADASRSGRGPRPVGNRARQPRVRPRALIGLAAPQVGEHRVRPQRDGAAVGLDRAERLVVAQGGVAPGQQGAVVALAGGRLIGQPTAANGQTTRTARPERAPHGWVILPGLAEAGTSAGRRGLIVQVIASRVLNLLL